MKMTMRKMLAVLATLAILCTVLPLGTLFSAVADDSKSFVNGDFEDGSNGWELNDSASIISDDVHGGNGALKIENPGQWAGAAMQTFDVDANSDYTIKMWVKRVEGTKPFNLYTMNGETNANITVVEGQNWFNTADADWTEKTMVVNTGDATSMTVKWSSETTNAGIILIDDMTVTKVGGEEPGNEPEAPATIENSNFDDGETHGWSSSSTIAVVDGALEFQCTQSWANIYKYMNAMKANTDYVYTFKARANMNQTMNIKVNNNWAADTGVAVVNVTTEWQDYEVVINSGDLTAAALVLFSSNVPADVGLVLYLDDITITEAAGDEPEQPEELVTVFHKDFEDGTNGGFERSVNENGYIVFDATTADWQNTYTYVNALKANTDYVVTFKAKANKVTNMNFKVNDNWGSDAAAETVDVTTEWQEYELNINMASLSTGIVIFSSNSKAADAAIYYIDDVKIAECKAPVTPDDPDEPSDSILPGGDFEAGVLPEGWTLATGGLSEICADAAKDGNYGMKLEGADYSEILNTTPIALKEGVTYTVDFDVKLMNRGKFDFQIKNCPADNNGKGNNFTVAAIEDASVDSWKHYTYSFTYDDTEKFPNDSFSLLFVVTTNTDFYLDNVVVTSDEKPDEPVTPPTTGDVLVNGGFENGSEGWELNDSCATIVDDARTGNGALQLSDVGQWAGAALQTVPVEPDTNYIIKMWVKREVGTKPFNLYIMDGETNANIKTVEGQNWFNTADADWTEHTIIVNTGSSTSMTVKWSAEVVNDGVLLIDDMQIYPEGQEPDAPVSDNPIKNSGFETGELNSNIMPGGVAGAWYNLWGSCTVTFEEPGYGGSKYALDLEIEGKWNHTRQDKIPVKPNTDYVVWAYVKNTTGMSIVIKDGDDTIGITTDEHGAIPEDMTNTWKLHKVEFNSGSYDSVCVLLIAIAENGGMGTFDDVLIYEKGKEPSDVATGPIKNSGFETGDLTDWNNLYDAVNYSFETPGRKDSKYALVFDAPGQWQQIRQDGVPVEPNTDYVVVAYAKNPKNINIVVKTGNDSGNIVDFGVADDMSNSWIRYEIPFNSGDETNVCVLLISNSENGGSALFDDIQIYKEGEVPPDDGGEEPPVTEGPMALDSYGVVNNRPVTPDANLILNGSFEDAEGGQWQSILGDVITVVDDETAPEGNKSLYFNTSGVEYGDKAVFYVDIEPNTDYIFSAWVKGAFISDTNRAMATFGVIDYKNRFLTYDDHVFSNKDRQIVPTCWDNEWHLRSVAFNSGVNIKVGIAITGGMSQMWLDGIALFKVDDGIKYADPRQISYILPSTLYAEEGGCAEEDSLIPDVNMDGAESQEFWSSAEGYKNGFLSFAENKYEYGTSLKYTASDKACNTYAIKWLDIEPNTTYTFSVDMRVVESGGGKLVLLDGKKREPYGFLMVDFDKEGYGADWFTIAVEFNSGLFDRIGIAVVDGGGEALIDNMRLFESVNRVAGGVEDDYVKPPYSFDDPEPDSPNTGVSVVGAALAMALVPSSALVAFKLRRKKEDEE